MEMLWDEHHPGVYIDAGSRTQQFFFTTSVALNRIRSKQVGRALLRSIAARCAFDPNIRVVIEDASGQGNGESEADSTKIVATKTNAGKLRYAAGEGCSSTVYFDPTDLQGDELIQRPTFIDLAHELIHAYHTIHGALYRPYEAQGMLGR